MDRVASKLQIKGITDNLFIYSLVIFSIGTIASIFKAESWITIFLFILGGVVVLIALILHIYFSIKKPEFLRSETYQLKKQTIEIIGDKDNLMNPHVKDLKYIASPFSLEPGEDKKNKLGNSDE